MKRFNVVVLGIFFYVSCAKDDTSRVDNPFIPSVNFTHTINLDLPQYNSLKFPNNSFVETIDGVGVKGVIIYNVDNTLYSAFELSDPNITPSSCSALLVEGIEASSNCDNANVYEIVSGKQLEGEGGYPLVRYAIRRDGNSLTITN
ncbi:hypothetical protein ACE939_14295 [Aquimarina sp. W85]|uniref:hypothetical protein n=1 Tax=Aquimarina rhodophyticola TaxID=3342246 RepID=UPI00338A9C6A|nr:hypothetical protein [Tritonibacter mobilis]